MRPLVLVGLPRSGTTWTASMLATAQGATLVSEPDNEKLSAPAISSKRHIGRFPVLSAGDSAPGYHQLWSWALSGAPSSSKLRAADRLVRQADDDSKESLVQGHGGGLLRLAGLLASSPRPASSPRSPGSSRVVIVKSVHACLALDWLATEFDIDVLIIQRHPGNVLSSWFDLALPDQDRRLYGLRAVQERFVKPWDLPPPGRGLVEAAAWQLGLLTAELERQAEKHPTWHVWTHEQLCSDPEGQFRALFADLDLTWGPGSSAFLEQGNKPGRGFSLQRDVSRLSESWRSRLDPSDAEILGRVLRRYPITTWNLQDLSDG